MVEKARAAAEVAEALEQARRGGRAVDSERLLWLDKLVDACDAVLAREFSDPDDWSTRAVLADVRDLRARLVAEVAEAEAAG